MKREWVSLAIAARYVRSRQQARGNELAANVLILNRLRNGEINSRGIIELDPPRNFVDRSAKDNLTANWWVETSIIPMNNSAVRYVEGHGFRSPAGERFRWKIHEIDLLAKDLIAAFPFIKAPPTLSLVSTLKQKGAGGRPPKHDWVRCAAFLVAWIVENSYPADRAALERVVHDWFQSKGSKSIPDDSSIYDFVTALYSERDVLLKARKKPDAR